METWANFANIRYTQNTISDVLQDGTPLQDLIVQLERGTTNAADLAVNVFKDKAGVFWRWTTGGPTPSKKLSRGNSGQKC
jgi:hypothetical protein